ncbi:hypothetical protein [Helicobacter cappadocius]|uniref:Transformation system protein n=1 Tax=Helicobacter cappadocius TaxID=3063998 RepID=A0AA90T8Y3_9HELI|nr:MULTISPECIES: hypothetical protein [unclassified Helicobacter]MDO7252415.1 hypothetical protein [Helicobacter sp. faydin-H75]MDP2538282.1 hypothetical protein [Helicobacter sp. faydin-H76]
MESLRNIFILCLIGVSAGSGEEFELPAIVIVPQKIQNFFSPNITQKIFLEMIFNKKAKINGKWYKKGDYFLKYKISEIANDLVVIKSSNDVLRLYINPKKSNLFKVQSARNKNSRALFSINKNPIIKGE